MNELIKIENNGGIKTVNARDLHDFLEVGTKFADWIKTRIEKFEFIEGTDYILLSEKKESGNNAISKEYYISLDMAKELSMVENNEKGKQARQYFIAIEKRAKELTIPKIPTGTHLLALAVIEANTVIESNKKQIEEMTPKAIFYDSVINSPDAVPMSKVAKVLNYKKMGRNNLFEFLRYKKVLQADNIPYQSFVDKGWFSVKESEYKDLQENVHIQFTTYVFQKGIEGIMKLLDKDLYKKGTKDE